MVVQFKLIPSQWNHIALHLISCCYSLVKVFTQSRRGSFITSSFLLTVRPKHIITRLKQLAYRRATAELSTYYLKWTVVGTCNASRNCALLQPCCRVSRIPSSPVPAARSSCSCGPADYIYTVSPHDSLDGLMRVILCKFGNTLQ